jgi:hypothetical protein
MIQVPAQPANTFLQQLEAIVILILGGSVPFILYWIKTKLTTIHAAQETNTAAIAEVSAKGDTIISQTDGVNQRLQQHIDASAGVIADQNQQIADLKTQIPKPPSP